MRARSLVLLPVLSALAACDAHHLGNPLLLPVSAVSTGLENANYNARRNNVSAYVQAHHVALMLDASQGGGPHLAEAYALARVPALRHATLTKRLHADRKLYRSDAEVLTVALMVHGA